MGEANSHMSCRPRSSGHSDSMPIQLCAPGPLTGLATPHAYSAYDVEEPPLYAYGHAPYAAQGSTRGGGVGIRTLLVVVTAVCFLAACSVVAIALALASTPYGLLSMQMPTPTPAPVFTTARATERTHLNPARAHASPPFAAAAAEPLQAQSQPRPQSQVQALPAVLQRIVRVRRAPPPARALDVESVRAVFPQWLADADRPVDRHYNTDAMLTDVVLAIAALVQQ